MVKSVGLRIRDHASDLSRSGPVSRRLVGSHARRHFRAGNITASPLEGGGRVACDKALVRAGSVSREASAISS